jgi:quercetin dioxygenase-like cupin family protein
MEILNVKAVEGKKIERYPYKGTPYKVKGVTIKWLSSAGVDKDSPDYGLRFFAVEPGGEIPTHNHFYLQTMYMLSGQLVVSSHDPETDKKVKEELIGPNDFVFVPSMEPHSMINPSDSEEALFLCCIANMYEGKAD